MEESGPYVNVANIPMSSQSTNMGSQGESQQGGMGSSIHYLRNKSLPRADPPTDSGYEEIHTYPAPKKMTLSCGSSEKNTLESSCFIWFQM